MSPSIGLAIYNFLMRDTIAGDQTPRAQRPAGELVHVHAPDPFISNGLRELVTRLQMECNATVLLTTPATDLLIDGVLQAYPPSEQLEDVQEFLDHWQPRLCLFAEGEVRPALVGEAAKRGIAQFMVEARRPRFPKGREGWYPGLLRQSLKSFSQIMALDESSATAFRKAGAALSSVQVAGRLEEPSVALPYVEAERAALAKLIATRPVWLAAGLDEGEEDAVIAAHRHAQGLAHRLLLIVAPADPARAPALVEKLAAIDGLIVADRAAEDEPEVDVSVLVADGMGEMGLWYRLAPVTFLGGTLAGAGCTRNPMEAAALGSAILHGPRTGGHGAAIGRLGAALGARVVLDARELADALSDLLAPDRAARMASAAWGVATEGAEVTERLITQLRALLGQPA